MRPFTGFAILAFVAVAAFVQVRPWLPGPHDPSALALSWAFQGLAWSAAVLIPAGLLRVGLRPGRATAGLVLIAAGLTAIIMMMAAAVQGALALVMLLLPLLVLIWLWLRGLAPRVQGGLLAIIPAVLAAIQFLALPGLERSARVHAMDAAEEMIADLDRHHGGHGGYPQSLVAVWPDYDTGIVGVAPFAYEAVGDSYQIAFAVPRSLSPTRTMAIYSPRDRWSAHSHAVHRVTLPPAEPDGRGHFADEAGDRPRWRLFHFD